MLGRLGSIPGYPPPITSLITHAGFQFDMIKIKNITPPDCLVQPRTVFMKLFVVSFYLTNFQISGIRQLQLVLLKVCCLLGVHVHIGVEFRSVEDPPSSSKGKYTTWIRKYWPLIG